VSGRGGWRSAGRQCASAVGRSCCFATDKMKIGDQGDAPVRGKKVGGEKEEFGSPWAPNRCGDARRCAELRR
jgi:hypothetical protein